MIIVEPFGNRLPIPGRRPTPPVTLTLPQGVLEFTQGQLRTLSDGVRESMVVWAGRPYADGALVTHVITPEVDAHYDRITLPNTTRAQLAMFLRREELLLFADLHTHPGLAFLSPADRARPLSTRPGFYALVIPGFAAGPTGASWRCYESTDSDWKEVSCGDRLRPEPR